MFCKCNEIVQTTTTHVVNYKNHIIIIKNVPCEECVQCGERYYSNEVAEQIEKIVDSAKKLMQEINLSFSMLEPYLSYYPDRIYKNMYESRLLYGISLK